MQGLLLVDKPAGWTSFDVVNYVRKIVAISEGKKPKKVKVGHSGTLDPSATGLLVLLVGKSYTKRAAELTKCDKTYEVRMTLGASSSTGDPDGEITLGSKDIPTENDLNQAFSQFEGEIKQTPPAFSAIKVNGQRAYDLARAGKTVSLEARQVTVSRLSIDSYNYPQVKFSADVSSGTYIRSLVEDIGHTLGTAAYTSGLRRIRVGKYELSKALTTSQLNDQTIADNLAEI